MLAGELMLCFAAAFMGAVGRDPKCIRQDK